MDGGGDERKLGEQEERGEEYLGSHSLTEERADSA